MKILFIAPPIGGIDVYTNALSKALTKLGANVEIMGSLPKETAYDTKRRNWKSTHKVKEIASQVADRIPFHRFDINAFHFGKNDIEQYIPVVIDKKNIQIKNPIYYVHFLSRNLFSDYLSDSLAQQEVEEKVYNFFKSYIFFGKFAKKYMETQTDRKLKGIISFHPESHSKDIPLKTSAGVKIFFPSNPKNAVPKVIFAGFAANYKDYNLLLESFNYVQKPMTFVFAGPGWLKRIGVTSRQIGPVNISVVERYLTAQEYRFACEYSDFGIFPYRQPANSKEVFQGSGALPNFLFFGKPCITLNEGVLPEYVGRAGIIVKTNNPRDLANAINKMLDPATRMRYSRIAKQRSHLFSIERHAKDCLTHFENLLQKPEQE